MPRRKRTTEPDLAAAEERLAAERAPTAAHVAATIEHLADQLTHVHLEALTAHGYTEPEAWELIAAAVTLARARTPS